MCADAIDFTAMNKFTRKGAIPGCAVLIADGTSAWLALRQTTMPPSAVPAATLQAETKNCAAAAFRGLWRVGKAGGYGLQTPGFRAFSGAGLISSPRFFPLSKFVAGTPTGLVARKPVWPFPIGYEQSFGD